MHLRLATGRVMAHRNPKRRRGKVARNSQLATGLCLVANCFGGSASSRGSGRAAKALRYEAEPRNERRGTFQPCASSLFFLSSHVSPVSLHKPDSQTLPPLQCASKISPLMNLRGLQNDYHCVVCSSTVLNAVLPSPARLQTRTH